MGPLFTFENLTFRYRDFLFEDYTDRIEQRALGIVGRNGSGKTTLLKLLDKQLVPQRGTVSTAGGTYLVDFDLRRYRHFTAADMVDLCRPLPSFDTTSADEVAERLQLLDYFSIPIGELSKGGAKKVSLLMGLLSTAPILLVDEPFESIDQESNQQLVALLADLDRGLVVVTHDEEHLGACVEAVYRVQDRRLVRQ